MKKKILRNYLNIRIQDKFKESKKPKYFPNVSLFKIDDFQLNKFFYKQIGKKHNWKDKLIWKDKEWTNYLSNEKIYTFVLKNKEELIGYFELILHKEKKESEIAYFGILEEFIGNKIGGFLLSEAIKVSFLLKAESVWVHTCSLDHPNAIKNYIARGMKIFKQEEVII